MAGCAQAGALAKWACKSSQNVLHDVSLCWGRLCAQHKKGGPIVAQFRPSWLLGYAAKASNQQYVLVQRKQSPLAKTEKAVPHTLVRGLLSSNVTSMPFWFVYSHTKLTHYQLNLWILLCRYQLLSPSAHRRHGKARNTYPRPFS
jgi:hypothetical protein